MIRKLTILLGLLISGCAAAVRDHDARVVVAFVVGTDGFVKEASVVSCEAPPGKKELFEEEALKTVKRWKFRPGPEARATRPILFRLNDKPAT